MNLETLTKKVKDAVQDPSLDDDDIRDLLNDGGMILAEACRLPSLSAGYGTVATVADEHQADMPTNYHRLMFRCMYGSRQINVRSNIEELLMIYGGDLTTAGDVVDVVVHGNKLIYQPIPETSADLTLFFSELPATLVKDADIPSFLPSTRNHKALALYAASEIFDDMEDGLEEGGKVNTNMQRGKFQAEVNKMVEDVTGRKTKKK